MCSCSCVVGAVMRGGAQLVSSSPTPRGAEGARSRRPILFLVFSFFAGSPCVPHTPFLPLLLLLHLVRTHLVLLSFPAKRTNPKTDEPTQNRRKPAGGLVRGNTVTTLKDGSSANLGEILVGVVLSTGSRDKTVRRGGRAQAVRCLLSCVSSTEIQVREREGGGDGSRGRERERAVLQIAQGASYSALP